MYTLQDDTDKAMPGLDGVQVSGPIPSVGHVFFHQPADEKIGPYQLRVVCVEHTLVGQPTGTLAASVVVYVESL